MRACAKKLRQLAEWFDVIAKRDPTAVLPQTREAVAGAREILARIDRGKKEGS